LPTPLLSGLPVFSFRTNNPSANVQTKCWPCLAIKKVSASLQSGEVWSENKSAPKYFLSKKSTKVEIQKRRLSKQLPK
jgi:hypothetical protein